MTLHFHWLHAPHWLTHHHVSRAMTFVLGVIGVSLLFSALRVVDAAFSGALIERREAVVAPAAVSMPVVPDLTTGTAPPGAGVPIETNAVEVPDATAEAVRL
jgi:Ca2+/H+ antiporter